MNADKTSVFIGVYRRSSAAIHVLAFFSNLARWRVILLRLLTLGALIGAAMRLSGPRPGYPLGRGRFTLPARCRARGVRWRAVMPGRRPAPAPRCASPVSYTHLRAHETRH